MRDNKTIAELFELSRQVPTEISLEETKRHISNFPIETIPNKSFDDYSNYNKFLNFKLYNMIVIPVALASILYFTTSTTNKVAIVPQINKTPTKSISKLNSPQTSQFDVAPMTPEPDYKFINNQNGFVYEKTTNKITPISSTEKTIEFREAVLSAKQLKTKSLKPSNSSNKTTAQVQANTTHNSTDPPDLSNRIMRQIKRKLYNNLRDDQLISFKGAPVTIELPKDRIIINDQELVDGLYHKYRELTSKAGYGPFRKIELHDLYIKLGDFTDSGFKGSGLGTFSLENGFDSPEDLNSLLNESTMTKDNLLKHEQEQLKSFANRILSKRPSGTSKNSLFHKNIKYEKAKLLHQELEILLIEHGFISTATDFALIEFQENETWVNGELLEGQLYQTFEKINKKYKVKHGEKRMILRSKNVIKIGDYQPGRFDGTIVTF